MIKEMPNPSELEKIQKENLTDQQIAKDKEREGVYEAGKNAGHKEILNGDENEFRMRKYAEKFADEIGLTGELRKLYIEGKIYYREISSGMSLFPQKDVTETQVLEFIKVIPRLDSYDVCGAHIISENIIKTIVDKFPNARFVDLNPEEYKIWNKKIIEIGGRID